MPTSCPRCSSESIVKNGRSRHGNQRYACQSCKATFGDADLRRIADDKRELALKHYAEGAGLRATERLVDVSHNSIMNWVRAEVAGKALERIEAIESTVIEADELWTFVGQKKQRFGSGGLLIALPKEFSAGRWVIATPQQPEHWVRRFLQALESLTPATSGTATATSSQPSSTARAKRTPSRLRAKTTS
jgi:transposase-like protein